MSVEKEIFYFILHHYFEIVSLIEFTLIMFPPDLINLQFCSNIFSVSIFIFNNFFNFLSPKNMNDIDLLTLDTIESNQVLHKQST